MTARRGFSMIELVTVLVIVGVTAAIAVPRYADSVRRAKVDGAARRMAADIERMRDRARTQGRDQRMYLASAGYVLAMTDDAGNLMKQRVDLSQDPYGVGVKPAVMANRGLMIDSLGRAAEPLVVYVTNGETSRGVIFDPTSGRTDVFVPGREADGRVHADAIAAPPKVREVLPVGVKTQPTQPSAVVPLATELADVW
jgi:prepilin-type N-terminal cleavage/methylation domain-containing protein